MEKQRLLMPETRLLKIKYETDFYDITQHCNQLLRRFSVKFNGEVSITETDFNQSGKRKVHKKSVDTKQVENLFEIICRCVFDKNSRIDYPVDDRGYHISLYFENRKAIKLNGIYYLGDEDTNNIFNDFFETLVDAKNC